MIFDRGEATTPPASSDAFRTLADQLPVFVWEHDVDGVAVWVNQTMCAFFGLDADELLATRWIDLVHPDDRDTAPALFGESIRRREPFHGNARVRRHDGTWRWTETWGRPRFDSAGSYIGYLGTSLDVTDRVEAERTTGAGAQFLRRLIDNLFAFVGLLTPDGTLIQANQAPLGAAGLDAADVIGRKFWDVHWWTSRPESQTRIRDAVERAALGETVRFDVQVSGAGDELIWLDFQVAPLRDDEGTVTHLVPSGHVISERAETEQRLAAALEAERLSRRRVELLQRNATQLARAITVDEVAAAVLGELQSSMGLGLTALNVLTGEHIAVLAPSSMPDEAVDRYQHVHVAADLPGPLAITTNRPVVVRGFAGIAERFPDVVDASNHLPPIETLAAMPLRAASGRAIGALFLASPEGDWLDDAMLDLLESVAGQTGLALERAQLHQEVLDTREQEHTIALQLQRALLPDRLVRHPNIAISARYSAASDLMAVGGDWYDTLSWPDGHVAVVVGDVVGHDVEAATTMGRLRIGVNALAPRAEPSPGAVLDAYRDYGHDLGPAFATAACVVLDTGTGVLCYSVAGHPPPVVLRPDGSVQWLSNSVAAPLGVPSAHDHADQEVVLEPGCTVIMYSDGLIERRSESLDEGFDRLAFSANRLAAADPGTLADGILADLTAGVSISDDVIVVCMRWEPVADPAAC